MNLQEKKTVLVNEINQLNQAIADAQVKLQRLIGQIQLLEEMEKEQPKEETQNV